jgi:hypothetical protein
LFMTLYYTICCFLTFSWKTRRHLFMLSRKKLGPASAKPFVHCLALAMMMTLLSTSGTDVAKSLIP